MPHMNGHGPTGQGAMSGNDHGSFSTGGQSRACQGQGQGRGKGRGRCHGRGQGAGCQAGRSATQAVASIAPTLPED